MELIKCFKALADKTRLRLLYLLQEYELNVNEIVQVVDVVQSGVSRHLKILVESDLLISRRDASYIYYSAAKNDTSNILIALIHQSDDLKLSFDQDIKNAKKIIKIRKNRTKKFFKTMASQWDTLKKEVLGNLDLDLIIKERILSQGIVSDLGCGTGELIHKLSNKKCEKLIGIDSSPQMLDQARQRLAKTGSTDLRLGELEYLPMKNREIDTAIMNMVLHHISQPELPLAEVYRVLKKEGMFILTDFEKHDKKKISRIMGGPWSGFEKEQIKTWLQSAGFNLLSIDSFKINFNLTINLFISQKI
ncbi:MAG: metalloregulator ArsR/SmtB family transcription factor [Desulfobacula sp.]|nr:metalloregulator ArsR/SmtB family transcription factor [Desulfobacula sp.]